MKPDDQTVLEPRLGDEKAAWLLSERCAWISGSSNPVEKERPIKTLRFQHNEQAENWEGGGTQGMNRIGGVKRE